jgi:hypothetical protein
MFRDYQHATNEDGDFPPLHPTLAALCIVLDQNEDLGTINRSHPDRDEHTYYNSYWVFPSDISNLLPPSADPWWERLGKPSFPWPPLLPLRMRTAEAARTTHAPQPDPPQRKVTLHVTNPALDKGKKKRTRKDVPMDVDGEQDVSSVINVLSSDQFLTFKRMLEAIRSQWPKREPLQGSRRS